MKNAKIGKIDTTELNVPPEKHEYETAKYFANRGYNIKFIKPSSIKGFSSPDFKMCGKAWETKSPLSGNLESIKRRLVQATKQSEHIIFDLRRIDAKNETKILRVLEKGSKTAKIKTLLVITKDGRLLTIKGKFGNITA